MGNMHEYFVKGRDFNIQKLIIFILSIGGAYIISLLMSWFSYKFGVNLWWVEIPSILGVYSLLENTIDKFWWSKFYMIPSFEGTWNGYLKSSYDDFTSETKVKCIIKQNAKLISVICEFENSTSYSTSATIDVTRVNGVTLKYDYINIPKTNQNKQLNIHLGNNTLKLNRNTLESHYYNDQRDTKGEIYLKKEEEN